LSHDGSNIVTSGALVQLKTRGAFDGDGFACQGARASGERTIKRRLSSKRAKERGKTERPIGAVGVLVRPSQKARAPS